MSPEQVSGDVDLDGRTDVYSVGLVLFQLLTGVVPTGGQYQTGFPPRLRRFATGLPEEFDTIAQKALAPNPEDRYSCVAELASDLALTQQQYERRVVGEPPLKANRPQAGKELPGPQLKASETLPSFELDTEVRQRPKSVESSED